jgi:hypothetical protein
LFGPAKGDEEKNIKTLLTGYQGFKSKWIYFPHCFIKILWAICKWNSIVTLISLLRSLIIQQQIIWIFKLIEER